MSEQVKASFLIVKSLAQELVQEVLAQIYPRSLDFNPGVGTLMTPIDIIKRVENDHAKRMNHCNFTSQSYEINGFLIYFASFTRTDQEVISQLYVKITICPGK